jgi:predicted PurR-regulated permease PerM
MTLFYYISFSLLLALFGYLNYRVLEPFLIPLAWAFILSILFYPAQVFLGRYLKWRSLASLILTFFILLLILGPFTYVSFLLVKELRTILASLEGGQADFLRDLLQHPIAKAVIDRVTAFFDISHADVNLAVADAISQLGKHLIGRAAKGVREIVTAVFHFFLMSITLFLFLRDGPVILKKAWGYLPFSGEQKSQLAQRVNDIIFSTLYGGVIVAVAQGAAGGGAFYLVGIASPVLWGLVMAVASFIPVFGAFMIWMPAAGYLFLLGEIGEGIVLLAMGTLVISTIDNFLRPWIIGNRSRMPFLALFFSVLGGIKLFGLIGIVMGPLILALFVSTIDIFRRTVQKSLPPPAGTGEK